MAVSEPAAGRPREEGEARPRLKEITFQNLLSFGPEAPPMELQALNVLIGPNGSGKSNFLVGIDLLRSTTKDSWNASRREGGVGELIWKGAPDDLATIEAVIEDRRLARPLRHVFRFGKEDQRFALADERIEDAGQETQENPRLTIYSRRAGQPAFIYRAHEIGLQPELVDLSTSILAQRRSSEVYPEITYLASCYEALRMYRDWEFGPHHVLRNPQPSDARNDRLDENLSNLGLILSRVRRSLDTKQSVLERLRDLYDGITDFEVIAEGGTVQVFLEEGRFTFPARRLSDGTLRYLCLLAILCDPTPPPLICIEEPELGLHPDILPGLADLLVEASSRTQLIVTTHSDVIVDALTERPEAVIVCEKHEGQTRMTRLDPDRLAVWLEGYRLGQLWSRGQIGGNRW